MNEQIIRWVGKAFLHTVLFMVGLFVFALAITNLIGAPACSLENVSVYSGCALSDQLVVLGFMFALAVVFSFGAAFVVPWAYFFYVGYTGKSWRWYVALPAALVAVWLMLFSGLWSAIFSYL